MDTDLTHPPSFIPVLAENLIRTNADVCIASRYTKGGGMKNVPAWRVALSKIANIFFAVFFNIHAKDITSGFKAYRAEKIKPIKIKKFNGHHALKGMV
jgi:dolichol-phosphate mannosyltransferase